MAPSRVGSTKPEWTEEQRSAIRKRWFVQERMIERSHNLPGGGKFTFSLYYFVKDFTRGDKSLKDRTILFVAGGPGQIVSVDAKNFVDMAGYRIVYFHLRGTGFSQLPADRAFDRFLQTSYAVEDIEQIRQDLNIDKWYGIIGHSYGCVLAQQYARKYSAQVNKLILSAPQAVRRNGQGRTVAVQEIALQEILNPIILRF
jgi:pimeloyl-ACP methyl ester carboxylesterase